MSRFTFTTCVLGMLLSGGTARLGADEPAPLPQVSPPCRVLEGLVGTWDTQITTGSVEVSGKSTSLGRVTRKWVADHKYIHERGSEHEAFITFDAQQSMYRAWYFHANGHVWQLTGRWTGNTDRFSLSAELDQNQALTRNFQLCDDKRHECAITWTDEDGRTGVYSVVKFTRCEPVSKESPGTKEATRVATKLPPPTEMKVFTNEVGKWDLEGSIISGEKTNKVSGSSVVQWTLDGQFAQSTTTIQGRKGETIYVAGFDAAAKTYRCWYFDAEHVLSEPAVGTWDEKEQAMTWKYQLTSDLVMVSKKQWLNPDAAKLHGVCSRGNGSVYYTQDGTITRQKGK